MKKVLSVVLCLVMAVAMMATLAGCKSDAQKIVGEWALEIDLKAAVKSILETDMADELGADFDPDALIDAIKDGTVAPVTLTFDEENVEVQLDGKAIEKFIENNLESIVEAAIDENPDMFGGMDAEELVEQLNSYYIEDFIDSIDDINDEFKEYEMTYTIEDGKLVLEAEGDELELEVKFKGSKELKITGIDFEDADDETLDVAKAVLDSITLKKN